jgi:carbonic anhydrase
MKMFRCLCRAGLGLALIVLLGGQEGERGEEAIRGEDAGGWGYTGANGPGAWGDLRPEYIMCSVGQLQSPIDVQGALRGGLAALKMDYRAVPLHVYNYGHTVGASYIPGSDLRIGREIFELKKMHFHTPSEHTIDGRHAPAEIHMVHKYERRGLAVVAILMEEGAADPILEEILTALAASPEMARDVPDVELDITSLTLSVGDFTLYKGSFTTPPCTEGVF